MLAHVFSYSCVNSEKKTCVESEDSVGGKPRIDRCSGLCHCTDAGDVLRLQHARILEIQAQKTVRGLPFSRRKEQDSGFVQIGEEFLLEGQDRDFAKGVCQEGKHGPRVFSMA